MKKTYNKPNIEIIFFELDIITESITEVDTTNGEDLNTFYGIAKWF